VREPSAFRIRIVVTFVAMLASLSLASSHRRLSRAAVFVWLFDPVPYNSRGVEGWDGAFDSIPNANVEELEGIEP